MVVATALRMGLAGYDGGAACEVAKNAGGKGQPLIVKGMVRQEWGEMGGGGRGEEPNKGRRNNDDNDNDNAAIAIAVAVGAIEETMGCPVPTTACPKPQPPLKTARYPMPKTADPKTWPPV